LVIYFAVINFFVLFLARLNASNKLGVAPYHSEGVAKEIGLRVLSREQLF
jgi:hypothetical protein